MLKGRLGLDSAKVPHADRSGLLYLAQAMEAAPRTLKKFISLNPSILQNSKVVDVIAQHKRR